MATEALLFMRSMLRFNQAWYRTTCHPQALSVYLSVLPLWYFTEDYFPFNLLFSVEIELWELWTWKVRVFTSRDGSQWETARCTPQLRAVQPEEKWERRRGKGANKVIECRGVMLGGCQTPNKWPGSCELVLHFPQFLVSKINLSLSLCHSFTLPFVMNT